MQMHSYVYIGGKYIGNGFALSEEQMRPNRLQAKLQAANARMDCHEDCGSLAPAEERQRLAEMVAQPLALLGWNGCPCTNIARTRFESMGACYLQQVGRLPLDLASIPPRSALDLAATSALSSIFAITSISSRSPGRSGRPTRRPCTSTCSASTASITTRSSSSAASSSEMASPSSRAAWRRPTSRRQSEARAPASSASGRATRASTPSLCSRARSPTTDRPRGGRARARVIGTRATRATTRSA